MPRRRIYVIRNGKTVDGVSYSADGKYYIIKRGKRQYFCKSDVGVRLARTEYDRLKTGGN